MTDKNQNQEKYKLYLENKNGNALKLHYSGRLPNIGEKIIFDISSKDFEALMINSKVVSKDQYQTFDIASLNDRFNRRNYFVTKVDYGLEFRLNELNLIPYVEAKEK